MVDQEPCAAILCDNERCVYQTGGQCRLNRISLDNGGICMECIWVEFDAKELEERKQQALRLLEMD